jgi:hypothetical protein
MTSSSHLFAPTGYGGIGATITSTATRRDTRGVSSFMVMVQDSAARSNRIVIRPFTLPSLIAVHLTSGICSR